MDIYLCSYRYHSWWKKNAPVCNCWQLWNTANFMRSINHLPTGAGFQNHPQYHYSLGYFVFSIFCGLAPHQKHTYDRITLWITICYGTWMNIVFSFEQSITGWWFQPLLKNISQLGWLFPTYGKMFQTTNQIIIINNLYILIRSITMFNYQWETGANGPSILNICTISSIMFIILAWFPIYAAVLLLSRSDCPCLIHWFPMKSLQLIQLQAGSLLKAELKHLSQQWLLPGIQRWEFIDPAGHCRTKQDKGS